MKNWCALNTLESFIYFHVIDRSEEVVKEVFISGKGNISNLPHFVVHFLGS